ncbi:MAG TPA: sigma-70 family RNA polymerase sigma factor [Blastocatellia bacterium]|jgi:RNA polymerase sigma-70 factor, ECF subfamily|nr:sigma-70 family RNA polymerase sigma factor [Blastocatellia bacterium]
MSTEDKIKEGKLLATATPLKPVPSPAEELESLFREHHDRVFRAAYRITGSIVDAEDVLQTVFLRLARRQEGIDLRPSPASYLHRAAVNAALDLLRQRARASAVPLDEVAPERLASPQAGPESAERDRELRGALRRAVAGLGERAAELFTLRYFEGYENREIAALLGMSPVVVGVLLHRARARVRKEIGEFYGG